MRTGKMMKGSRKNEGTRCGGPAYAGRQAQRCTLCMHAPAAHMHT